MDNDCLSELEWFFEKRCMEKDALGQHTIDIWHDKLCEIFLVFCFLSEDIYECDFEGIFLLYIDVGKAFQNIACVFQISWEK